jgi:hypothetical protein
MAACMHARTHGYIGLVELAHSIIEQTIGRLILDQILRDTKRIPTQLIGGVGSHSTELRYEVIVGEGDCTSDVSI